MELVDVPILPAASIRPLGIALDALDNLVAQRCRVVQWLRREGLLDLLPRGDVLLLDVALPFFGLGFEAGDGGVLVLDAVAACCGGILPSVALGAEDVGIVLGPVGDGHWSGLRGRVGGCDVELKTKDLLVQGGDGFFEVGYMGDVGMFDHGDGIGVGVGGGGEVTCWR